MFASFLTFKNQFYSTANARLMNISVEGISVLKNLDILATVGKNAPYVYTVPQTFAVSDGGLTIALASAKQNPIISGIEVLPASPKTPLHRINCGSTTQVTDSNNAVWSADQYFISSGKGYNTCGTVTNNIYCTSRYFRAVNGVPFRYNIPVPASNASYQLRLHFAEQVSATCCIQQYDAPFLSTFDLSS
jgi:Malectin domain